MQIAKDPLPRARVSASRLVSASSRRLSRTAAEALPVPQHQHASLVRASVLWILTAKGPFPPAQLHVRVPLIASLFRVRFRAVAVLLARNHLPASLARMSVQWTALHRACAAKTVTVAALGRLAAKCVRQRINACSRRLWLRAVEVLPVPQHLPASLVKMSVPWILTAMDLSRNALLHARRGTRGDGSRLWLRVAEVLPVRLLFHVSLVRASVLWILTVMDLSRNALLHARRGTRGDGSRLWRRAAEVPHVRLLFHVSLVRASVLRILWILTVMDLTNHARARASLHVIVSGLKLSLRAVKVGPAMKSRSQRRASQVTAFARTTATRRSAPSLQRWCLILTSQRLRSALHSETRSRTISVATLRRGLVASVWTVW